MNHLLLFSLFIPLEVHYFIGPVRVEPYRVVLIISFIYMLILRRIKIDDLSIFLILYVLMCSFSLFINHNYIDSLQASVMLFLEVFVSYSIGKAFVRNRDDHVKVFKLIGSVYFFLAFFAFYEFFTGNRVIHNFFYLITGNFSLESTLLTPAYERMGFTRVTSTFSHPILYSASAVIVLPILLEYASTSNTFKKMTMIFGPITAIITSITSAGIVALIIQYISYLWNKHLLNKRDLKKIIYLGIIFIVLFIEMFSNRGALKFIVSMITLNPHTAYYRIMQWEFASDDVADNFFFGIGHNPWTHPFWFSSSIDSYWLVNMVQYGVFAVIFLSIFFIKYALRTYDTNKNTKEYSLSMRYSYMIISVIFVAFTVHYFDRMQPFLFYILGTASWIFEKNKKLSG